MVARLHIEGKRELDRTLKAWGGKEGRKELGQVHKTIGGMVIDQAGGADSGVGSGAGSKLRPSAATREVTIRAGGKHRSRKVQQWGKTPVMPHPFRPNIVGAAEQIKDRISDAYLDGVESVLRPLVS